MFEKIKSLLRSLLGLNTLDYICGTEALPLPLSSEEERAKLTLLENGDQRAKAELVEHNLRLVVYIAKKFDGTGADGDDLVSVGTIGLIKAIDSFRADKNIKLATYASRCIENEILMYLRRLSRSKQEVSFDEPLNTDWEGNELLLSDVMGTDADSVYSDVEGGVERELLKKSLSRLSMREQKIMRMRFGLDGDVAFAELDWNELYKMASRVEVLYAPLPKTQPVRRDLALLLDNDVTFAKVEEAVRKAERKLLRDVWLFDVYEGKNLPAGKKSYAIAMTLQDDEKTLNDRQIDAETTKIVDSLKKNPRAVLR